MQSLALPELFQKGGVFMWPLLVCSVLGVAVILERGLVFLRLTLGGGKVRRALAKVRLGRIEEALPELQGQSHPLAAVALTVLKHRQRPEGLRLELVKAEGSRQLARVEKRLRILATISHLAPLIGLLGTVTGLVLAFAAMQTLGGAAKPSDLAGGIWEALLTTVFGLLVAIPCMAAYHGFEGLADQLARDMQCLVTELDDALDLRGSTDEPPVSHFTTNWSEQDLQTVG